MVPRIGNIVKTRFSFVYSRSNRTRSHLLDLVGVGNVLNQNEVSSSDRLCRWVERRVDRKGIGCVTSDRDVAVERSSTRKRRRSTERRRGSNRERIRRRISQRDVAVESSHAVERCGAIDGQVVGQRDVRVERNAAAESRQVCEVAGASKVVGATSRILLDAVGTIQDDEPVGRHVADDRGAAGNVECASGRQCSSACGVAAARSDRELVGVDREVAGGRQGSSDSRVAACTSDSQLVGSDREITGSSSDVDAGGRELKRGIVARAIRDGLERGVDGACIARLE